MTEDWTTNIGHDSRKARNPDYDPDTSWGGSQGMDYTCTCGMVCERCNTAKGLCGYDGMMYSPSKDVVVCGQCRSSKATEEGNAPIQDPMELGEMANWTPLDGSEGLKRKRAENIGPYEIIEGEVHCGRCDKNVENDPVYAELTLKCNGCGHTLYHDDDASYDVSQFLGAETFEADFDYYYSVSDKTRGMEILDRLRTMNPETKSKALDWLIDNGFLHSEEDYNSAYINAMGDALYITSEEDDYDAEVRMPQPASGTWSPAKGGSATISKTSGIRNIGTISPSATIPVNYPKHLQPDWQKTPASSKKMAKEMRQALETEDPAARHAAIFAMQDKYGDYWNQQSFNDAFKKEMEGSEPAWVKPVATALGFALGFFGIHEIKKVL